MRVKLLRLAPNEHILLLTNHHIISDGWSVGIFARDLMALYTALSQGAPSPLAELPIQYADFATWQRERLQSDVLEQQLSYWRRQLTDVPVLELPTDYPRPTQQRYLGRSVPVRFDRVLTERLRALSHETDSTLFMTLLTAWLILLQRYSRQDDIVVGTPAGGRMLPETEPLIGCFLNTLVLRTDLRGKQTFRDVLEQVRVTTLEAYAHQEVPFEAVVDAVQPTRDLSRQALFQVMVVWLNASIPSIELPELTLQPIDLESTTAKFDLTLSLSETPSDIIGIIEYAVDLFKEATITRMIEHLQLLLERVAARPDQPLADLSLLTPQEEQQVLIEWNATQQNYRNDRCFHELFAAQAQRTPDAIAVIYGDRQMSYAEIDTRANQLAHYLRQQGVGTELCVAICAERSPELVIGLLGILKAGGAYLPIDPDQPVDRIQFMLVDSQAVMLLTQQAISDRLPATNLSLTYLDTDWPTIAQYPFEAPPCKVDRENLVYLIYTSGSTGTPKGVMIPHHGLMNYLFWAQAMYTGVGGYGSPVHSSVSFDLTVTSLFVPLLAGQPVVMLVEEQGGMHLSNALCDHAEFNLVKLTPAHLSLLSQTLPPQAAGHARALVIGGEALYQSSLAFWRTYAPDVQLINEYGPTETVVGCTVYNTTADTDATGDVPIGKPVPNTQIYVLDQYLQPVPIGVPGELFIGGAQVGRGYLRRPALTAEKFIPNPFGNEPGARLYRTGDLARYRPDGVLEFLGRLDHQVKIHGFRIELGEIEAALFRHPQIQEGVVLVSTSGNGSKQLVAYIVPEAGESLLTHEIRSYLEERLPEYMVPTTYVVLEQLPVTRNGKVDRAALPAPDPAHRPADQPYVPPRSTVEATLAQIWADVLDLPHVGIHDNFFALGGDSILSIQIVARAAQAGFHCTLKAIFQHQTIAALAPVVTAQPRLQPPQDLVAGPVPLTPIQHWFFDQALPAPHHYNQAVLLRVAAPLDLAALSRALAALIRHHDALRLRFTRTPHGWHQQHAPLDLAALPLAVHDLAPLPPPDQPAALAALLTQTQQSLDLAAGPLLRVVVCHLGAAGTRLLLVIHHLVVDGVSWRILLDDLDTAYAQAHAGQVIRLPTKTSAFQQWATYLQQAAQPDALSAALRDWAAQPWSSVVPPPVEWPDGRNTVAVSRQVTVTLSPTDTRTLLQAVPPVYRTQINDVLLLALLDAWTAWSGQPTLLVALEGHGRDAPDGVLDLTRTVGWFTTLLPVLLQPVPGDLGTRLKAIKEHLRRWAGQGLTYGLLRSLHPAAAVRAEVLGWPQPALSFNYLGQIDQGLGRNGQFALADEGSGPERADDGQRAYEIEVNSYVRDGVLTTQWTYSAERYSAERMTALAEGYGAALRAIMAYCATASGGYTPSDFPLAGLTQPTLDRLVAQVSAGAVSAHGARVPALEAIYPLSPMQQGMLFHSLYDPNEDVYFEQTHCAIHEPLNVEGFKQSWQLAIDHHAVLRTAFHWEHLPQPLQVVYQHVAVSWTQLDWSELDPEEQQARLDDWLAMDSRMPLDLNTVPLMRLTLIQMRQDVVYFIWSHHHLLLDGWSVQMVIRDVFACYQALNAGQIPRLPASPPYSDYIAWLQQQDLQAAELFWRTYLAGFKEPTPFRVGRSSGARAARAHYAEQQIELSESTTAALQSLARHRQITLNTVTQGAWALLLSRYSGTEDVVFGITVSGRPAALPQIEAMVGLLINTLPVRVRVSATTQIHTWLHQLQEQQIELHEYEYTPLVQIQGWSELPRGTALFESLVVFENYPVDMTVEQQGRDLGIRDVHSLERHNYPIALLIIPGVRLHVRAIYDEQRFAANTIARMLQHFQTLLTGIAAAPQQRLCDLSLLDADERHQLMRSWHANLDEYPVTRCLHDAVAYRATHTPQAVAVVYEQQSLTYRELDQRANQLAHHLQSLGVGPEVPVAIYMERSLDLVIGLLGILKAGGAYLPIDPAYPPERITFMLQDSQALVLLTQQSLAASLPSHVTTVVALDQMWPLILAQPTTAPDSRVTSDNLAYIIYTSGSTGRPKGTALPHRNVMRLFAATDSWFQFTASDVWTLFHSVAFDFSVWEIWGALLYGGRLVVVPYWISRTPDAFYDLIVREGVTVLNQTPSAFRQIIPLATGAPLALRFVIFGGEALNPDHLQPWVAYYGDSQPQIINMYGITETTVHVTYRPITQSDIGGAMSSPIGGAIPDMKLVVLDQYRQPVPIGVPGELYVAGAGLARGYLNRPALTAERFIPDPFSTEPGARLYKTGDLVRYTADGDIEYLGRIDQQVKVRGFRIELGEIEAALTHHPAVREAVALAREEIPGEARLVAYIVPQPGVALTIEELRTYLLERLPEHMIPAAFGTLDRLPLTTNGKVDRSALPTLNIERPNLAEHYVAPRTPVETALCEIWASVLQFDQIGIHDNFFELGGDSILSIQIVARAAQSGLRCSPKDVFQHQTIAELAAVVGRSAVTADQGLVMGMVPLTPIQRWFFTLPLPNLHHYNQALLLEVRQKLNVERLAEAIRRVMLHHDALRLRFTPTADGWLQEHAEPTVAARSVVVEQVALPIQQQAAAIEGYAATVQASLNITEGPLLRAVLFDGGDFIPSRLLLVIHHLAVDGVSWRILLEDLQTIYNGLEAGQPVQLPSKTTSFKQWAEHLIDYAHSPALDVERAFWLSLPWNSVRSLPRDHEVANLEIDTQMISVVLNPDDTQALLQDVPPVYHTHINEVLLTALARVLASWSGSTTILIDQEGHGREDLFAEVDLSRTVGWFTTIFPVILNEAAELPIGESLKSIKEQVRRIPQRGIGYGLLREIRQDPAIQSLPIAEVSFNYLGQFDQTIAQATLFAPAQEATGPGRSREGQRLYLLEITAFVSAGQLHLNWVYSSQQYDELTIAQVAQTYITTLQAIIEHCQHAEAESFTPSDMPHVQLSQSELDDLIDYLDELEE